MLEVSSMTVSYGKARALSDVSIIVPEKEIVCLLGANGAGKTTTLKAISGLISPNAGEIRVRGKIINGLSPAKIVKLGISMVPEGRGIFNQMNVFENLEMGAFSRKDKRTVKKDMVKVFELFPVLKGRQKQNAATLSGGEQQMLAIGRALLSRPKILLLDEPSLGLAPSIVTDIFDILQTISKIDECTILLVEQNAHMALDVSRFGYIMECGEIVLSGYSKDLVNNQDVRAAYLGEQ